MSKQNVKHNEKRADLKLMYNKINVRPDGWVNYLFQGSTGLPKAVFTHAVQSWIFAERYMQGFACKTQWNIKQFFLDAKPAWCLTELMCEQKTNRPANSWFRESSCSASLSLNPDSSPALTKQSISRSEKESDCLLLCSTKEKEHFWIIIWPDSPNIVQTCENRIFDYFVYWLWICAAVSQMKKIK